MVLVRPVQAVVVTIILMMQLDELTAPRESEIEHVVYGPPGNVPMIETDVPGTPLPGVIVIDDVTAKVAIAKSPAVVPATLIVYGFFGVVTAGTTKDPVTVPEDDMVQTGERIAHADASLAVAVGVQGLSLALNPLPVMIMVKP